MSNEHQNQNEVVKQYQKGVIRVIFKSGLLTIVVAGLAIVLGVWLDKRGDTFPRWTLIFLLGSVPVSLGSVIFMVRRYLKQHRIKNEEN